MKVAIAWYGAEGQSSYRYFTQLGHDVTIVTPRVASEFPLPNGANAIVGDDAFDQLNGFDLVVRSSSVRPDALKTDGKIWSNTNEFFAHCPAPIIGVTGTKGKGTTCSLIASILRAAGKTVHLVGNIGAPALSQLSLITSDDIVVYELSSFQLWDIQQSPHVAVVLMIEPDHLDVHRDMTEYLEAKAGIAKFQTPNDVVFFHPTNDDSRQVASVGEGKKLRYGIMDDGQVYVRDEGFYIEDRFICSTGALQIAGVHNLENACAAISVAALILGATDHVEAGLRAFSGLPHRLKHVRVVENISYYDDSVGTTPGSAISALRSFGDAPKVVILGGFDKGASYDAVVQECYRQGASVVAIGQNGEKIAALCEKAGVRACRVVGRMDEVVAAARAEAQPGGVVILSPASASFDQYKSYSDRGDQFAAAVEAL